MGYYSYTIYCYFYFQKGTYMKLDSRWAISLSRRHGFWCLRVTNFKDHRCISLFWAHKLTAWNHVSSTSMLTDGFNFPGKFNACHSGSSSQIVIEHDNLFQPPVYLASAADLYAVNLENSGRRPEYSWHRHCHGVVGCTIVFDCFCWWQSHIIFHLLQPYQHWPSETTCSCAQMGFSENKVPNSPCF